MQFKTMLSKILSTAIAAITVISPLGVNANPTTPTANPEATKVSNQHTFANPDLIPPPVPARKRKSTKSTIPTNSPMQKNNFNKLLHHHPTVKLPYDISIHMDNYFSKESSRTKPYVFIKFWCNGELTNRQKILISLFCQKVIEKAQLYGINVLDPSCCIRSYGLNNLLYSGIIPFKVDTFNSYATMDGLKKILNYECNKMNIKFNNIGL